MRAFLSKTTNTVLDAAPHVTLGLLRAARGVLGADSSIQFSNNSSDPITALGVTPVAASTRTDPAIILRTFSGSGIMSRTNIIAGVFWRFSLKLITFEEGQHRPGNWDRTSPHPIA